MLLSDKVMYFHILDAYTALLSTTIGQLQVSGYRDTTVVYRIAQHDCFAGMFHQPYIHPLKNAYSMEYIALTL